MFKRGYLFGLSLCLLLLSGKGCGYLYEYSHNMTSCEDFERGARFKPQDAVLSQWKIIYFWAENTEMHDIIFSLPSKKRLDRIRALVDEELKDQPYMTPEWEKVVMLMEPRPGTVVVMLDQRTVGAYRALVIVYKRNGEKLEKPIINLADVRFKMVKPKYMAMMACEDLTAYLLAPSDDVPQTEEECGAAAALLAFKGRIGHSYLYIKKLRQEL